MATIAAKSVERTKADLVPQSLLTPDELRGRVRVHKTTYTWLSGYVDSGSTITGSLLPSGAKIVGGTLYSEAMATNGAMQVTINSVALHAAKAFSTSAGRDELPDGANFKNIFGVDFGGYAPVITTSVAAAVAGNKVDLHLFYVVD